MICATHNDYALCTAACDGDILFKLVEAERLNLWPHIAEAIKVWQSIMFHLTNRTGEVQVGAYCEKRTIQYPCLYVIIKDFRKELEFSFREDDFVLTLKLFEWVDKSLKLRYDDPNLIEKLKYPLRLFNVENSYEEYGS